MMRMTTCRRVILTLRIYRLSALRNTFSIHPYTRVRSLLLSHRRSGALKACISVYALPTNNSNQTMPWAATFCVKNILVKLIPMFQMGLYAFSSEACKRRVVFTIFSTKTSCYTSRTLVKPGKRDLRNCRIIASLAFTDKWCMKAIEQFLMKRFRTIINPCIGGVLKGSTMTQRIVQVNAAIQHAYVWAQPLVTGKLDITKMFAHVDYKVLADTLWYFEVPAEWVSIFLAQVSNNSFCIQLMKEGEVQIDLYRGLV